MFRYQPLGDDAVTNSSSCMLFPPGPGGSLAQSTAQASESFTAVDGLVSTDATAGISPELNVEGFSMNSSASDTVDFATGGPARAGLIELTVTTISFRQLNLDAAQATISDGTHEYVYNPNGTTSTPGSCSFGDVCRYQATLPLDLGATFTISAFGNASSISPTFGGGESSEGTAIVGSTLFEASGAGPVPFVAFPAPEPSTLLCLGFLAIALACACGKVSLGA